MRHVYLAAIMAFAVSAAQAEIQTIQARSGAWAFYTVEDFSFRYGYRSFKEVEGCTVSTGGPAGQVRMVLLPGKEVLTEVSSSSWSFSRRTAEMRISWEGKKTANTTYGDTEYDGTALRHVGNRDLARIIAAAIADEDTGGIEVFDRRDRRIARFPSKGLPDMLRRAIKCSETL